MASEGLSRVVLKTLSELTRRSHSDGGFCMQAGGQSRPDATAWALLALKATRHHPDLQAAARLRLTQDQQADGRIAISPTLPEAFWPTPLAMLAWKGDPAVASQQARAAAFLLKITGRHWPRTPEGTQILGHDTALQGWPWVSETHSWIEPTSLAMMALKAAGSGTHPRVREALRMVLNRQLPKGGWNYGNTHVFGQTLRPMPETTGMALAALKGLCEPAAVAISIDYLQGLAAGLGTPLALGWTLVGLSAWNQRPAQAADLVQACLALQSRYGAYDTMLLSLLVLAQVVTEGQLGEVA